MTSKQIEELVVLCAVLAMLLVLLFAGPQQALGQEDAAGWSRYYEEEAAVQDWEEERVLVDTYGYEIEDLEGVEAETLIDEGEGSWDSERPRTEYYYE